MKIFLNENVFDKALERLNFLFDEFDQIIVSFSGGKDSTLTMEMALKVAEERNRLPLKGEIWEHPFTIEKYSPPRNSNTTIDQYLPIAHTCFFTIDLPEYTTEEIMYEKILFAITHCATIDADNFRNPNPNENLQ